MVVRLILALLLAAFVLPGAASARCHDDGAMQGMAMTHHAPAPPAMPEHGCIGCIPPSDWLREPMATPMVFAAPTPETEVAALDLGRGGPPALPPPRMG